MRRLSRIVYTVLGCLFIALGVLGAFLPVLPTVPFMLLAAACLMRGSRSLYHWLMTHERYGEHIYQYRQAKAMTRRTKVTALVTLWIGITVSVFIVPLWWCQVGLVVVALCVSVYLGRFQEISQTDLDRAKDGYEEFLAREFGTLHQ